MPLPSDWRHDYLDWHLYYKVYAVREDVEKLVDKYAPWRPVEEPHDGVDELQIVRGPYEHALVVLFHEDGQLGVQPGVDAAPLTVAQQVWLAQRAVRQLESEPYFDYELNEETTAKGPYTRYPLSPDEAKTLVLELLRDFLAVPADEPLLATTADNPDEWPTDAPADAPPI